MKKPFSSFLFLFLFLLVIPVYSADLIHSFDVDIYVSGSGSLTVEEHIRYDFKNTYRHGIFREIPYKYKKGKNNYNLDIDVKGVRNSEGKRYKYKTSRKNGRLTIKIGDAGKTITGINDYIIEYVVENPFLYFEDYDELYWNSTGTEWWNIPINESTTRVYLESELPSGISTQCFTGSFGSTESNCRINLKENYIEFISSGQLGNGKGITVDIALPKGIIKEPGAGAKFLKFLMDNMVYSIPLFIFIGLFGYWKRHGKDPVGRSAVTVLYEPPENMNPAEAGTLYDERADMVDITSTVVDLAVRGYLRIEEIKSTKFIFLSDTDYKFIRINKEDESGLKKYETLLLSGLFENSKEEVIISELKNKFYKHLPDIEEAIYGQLISDKMFPASPERIRHTFVYLGLGILILGLSLVPGFQWKIVIAITGLMFMAFSKFMPRKTRKGAVENNRLLGFREFIDRVETDRIRRMAEDDPTVFERVLPFALVFGLEDKWAEAFSSIFTEPPKWYSTDHYGPGFHPGIFIDDLGRSINTMNKSFLSSPKNSGGSRGISAGGGFGGGGFSGGGFGGGGGGSW